MAPVSYLETSVLYCDDNLRRLSQFPSECVDLIYLDPPFFSNKHYEVIWGDEAEVRSFDDRWDAGLDGYLNWMQERLVEMHRVLKRSGSLYLHCDWHAAHHLKVMLDGIFGTSHFRNDIIWHYSGWNKKLRTRFENRADNILFYAKGAAKAQIFNGFARPWASEEEYVKVRKQKVREDDNGRRYVLSDAGGGKRAKRYLDEGDEGGRLRR
jgi:DNA modification methylase